LDMGSSPPRVKISDLIIDPPLCPVKRLSPSLFSLDLFSIQQNFDTIELSFPLRAGDRVQGYSG